MKFKSDKERKEYEEYKKSRDIINYHLDTHIKNMSYEDYDRFSKILFSRSVWKSSFLSTMLFLVISISTSIFSILTAILFTPFTLFALILITSLPLTITYLEFSFCRDHKLNNELYRLIKKKGRVEDVKSYVRVYKQKDTFEQERKEYEFSQAKKTLDKVIEDSSSKIRSAEYDVNNTSKNVGKDIEKEIIVPDEYEREKSCNRLGLALPLIAKMLKKYDKIKVIPIVDENADENENEDTVEDSTTIND